MHRMTVFMSVAMAMAMIAFSNLAVAEESTEAYRAELSPLNTEVTKSQTTGEAHFMISGDELTIRISVEGAPSNMQHLQHFHGFAEGDQAASCPTLDDDTNGDGVVDLRETEPVVGITMVPFHDDPVGMEIERDTYPAADASGAYVYERTVSLKALRDSFVSKFPGQELNLETRVVMLHGIPASMSLPSTVASLDNIPAQVTIPIACGAIRRTHD